MSNSEQVEISMAFQQLSCQPSLAVIDTYLPFIERFVNYCYGYGCIQSINYVRFKINCYSDSMNLRIPPCLSYLKLLACCIVHSKAVGVE